MTPFIFRKYPGYNPNEIKCWTASTVIDTNSFDVEDIVVTKGSSKAGTSIPSPLARMELFDTAFHIAASDQKNNLKGNTIYHQLVSDCLDILQLIYNIKNEDIGLNKKLWFKEWKVKENIDKLKSKGDLHPNYLLGKSLDQIFSDKINPRFSSVDSIFLIYYETKLLGGTSPLTLVFTTPNWSRYIKEGDIRNIPQSSDGDIFFDNDYKALFERDKSFVEYMYKLLLQNKDAFAKADGLRKYIYKTIEIKFPEWKNDFQEFRESSGAATPMDDEYSKVLTNIENKYLTVNGMFFYHQKEGKEQDRISKVSDFLIKASVTKYNTQINDKGETKTIYPPLVLVDGMNYSGDYTEVNVPWNSNTKVKDVYHRYVPLYERRLPQGNSQSALYPFITSDDFLEDVLLEMPFYINRTKFFSGYKGDFKYLLPVKKEYFNFFTLADLKNNLTVVLDEGEVKVKLKVPIRNKKGVPDILFSKSYSKQKGTISLCSANIGIYPFYQVTDSDNTDYAILLADMVEKDKNNEQLALHFFSLKNFASDDTRIETKSEIRSVCDGQAIATSKFYRFKTAFDYMEVVYHPDDAGNIYNGLIIPDFTNRTYNKGNLIKSFTFALDFGTSNTHVAWMEKDEALPKPFEIEPADQQMVLLHEPAATNNLEDKYRKYGLFPEIDLILRREFVPPVITSKDNAAIAFPFKTASCEIIEFNNIETSKRNLFSHINIGYYIDKEEKKGNIIYTTNLKWLLENSNDDANKSRVKFFLQQLFWQIKSKTILNNGKLAELKIVWSVPLSMERGNRTTLQSVLIDAFKNVFDDGSAILKKPNDALAIGVNGELLKTPIPESVAPYFFLTNSGSGIQDIANTVNIDIGGGTTDIMMFMESAGADRDDKYVTSSFRFAGNDIWGSGYKGKLKDNGFLKNYLAYQKANNINPEEVKYFKKGTEDANINADDLISLLFKYDDKFKFSDSVTIGNPGLSLVLYLHFSAIVYHIVQIIEAKGYPMPRYLSFTGKGSQYIKLLCGGDEAELEAFTKLLIKVYTDLPIQSSFKIHLNGNPKEITANGSVLYSFATPEEKNKYNGDFEFIHPGFNPKINPDLGEKLTAGDTQEFLISETLQVNSVLNVGVLNNINNFLEKTLTNRNIIDYLNDFKVKNVAKAYEVLRWNGNIDNGEGFIYDSYRKVLNNLRYQDKESPLPESLFFFGLKDALYQLSKYITDAKS
ncbi:MAG TPA: hypothetical protein VIJ92_15640 [Ginsengibacter sp.]